jgi:hypothetical protein
LTFKRFYKCSAACPTFSNLKKVVRKNMAGDAVQNNLVLIIVPLFALLALAIIFVVIPIFAGMVGSGSASVGLVSMSNTMASFAPIYGIGLAIGLLVMFFGLAAWFAGR